MSAEKDLHPMKREKPGAGSTLAVMGAMIDQLRLGVQAKWRVRAAGEPSIPLCAAEGAGWARARGLWGAAGKCFKGKKTQSHSAVTAAKALVCFILSKQNSFCRGSL